MKNHNKDAQLDSNRCMVCKKNIMRKSTFGNKQKTHSAYVNGFYKIFKKMQLINNYFFWYITSFTNFTVLSMLGRAAATRFGA